MDKVKQNTPRKSKVWLLPLLIAIGVAIAVLIVKSRPVTEHHPASQPPISVRTILLEQFNVKPSVIGYGQVRPDVLLDTRAEVAGKIVFVHPQLKKGNILPKGTLVVEIDDSDYRLAFDIASANLTQRKANLSQQHLLRHDAAQALKLAQDKLRLAKVELVRFEKLLKQSTLAQSSVDDQRAAVVKIQQEVQSLQNQLDLIPLQIEIIKAQLKIAKAEVQTQELNLARTKLYLPFDARITSLNIEANQFVTQGASLYSAQTMDKVVVNAQFPLQKMQFLARSFALKTEQMRELFKRGEGSSRLIKQLGLTAKVRLAGNSQSTLWHAEVERISNDLDPRSRTVGVIVSISAPYQQVATEVKPPLMEGMYMKVELQGRPLPFKVIPRDAVHQGEVYLVDQQHKLRRIAVSGDTQQQELLLDPQIALPDGAQVVISDLFPAIDGMPLAPKLDTKAQQALAARLEAL